MLKHGKSIPSAFLQRSTTSWAPAAGCGKHLEGAVALRFYNIVMSPPRNRNKKHRRIDIVGLHDGHEPTALGEPFTKQLDKYSYLEIDIKIINAYRCLPLRKCCWNCLNPRGVQPCAPEAARAGLATACTVAPQAANLSKDKDTSDGRHVQPRHGAVNSASISLAHPKTCREAASDRFSCTKTHQLEFFECKS